MHELKLKILNVCLIPSIQVILKTTFYKVSLEQEEIPIYRSIIESSIRISNVFDKKQELREISRIFSIILKKHEILDNLQFNSKYLPQL